MYTTIIIYINTFCRFFAYSLIKPDVSFSYTGTGSGAGRKAVRRGLVDFAGSDAPLTATDLKEVSSDRCAQFGGTTS